MLRRAAFTSARARIRVPVLILSTSVLPVLAGCGTEAPVEPVRFVPHADLIPVAVFVVNSADDVTDAAGCDGTHCSLREAIQAANATPDADRIEFAIPGDGPHVIQPASDLPVIFWPVEIDGYTQPGSSENTDDTGTNADIRIVLDGSVGQLGVGLNLTRGDASGSDGSSIAGLAIGGFLEAIRVQVPDVVIRGNFIGVDPAGTLLANVQGVVSEANVTVGGTDAGDRNLISGNLEDGLFLQGGATVQGNLIGVNAGGDAALPNGRHGIQLQAADAVIGGSEPGARNVISGNGVHGIYVLSMFASSRHRIEGNRIGTDATGTAAVPNGGSGILLQGASDNVISDNLIAGHVAADDLNGGAGIRLISNNSATSDRNIIAGNRIGTDAAGTAALPNAIGVWLDGSMNVLGGTTVADRNIISGNTEAGVVARGTETLVRGNFIGVDATGMTALPNAVGIRLFQDNARIGGYDAGEGNVISGNTGAGVEVVDHVAGSVEGNLIGVAVDGSTPLPNNDGIVVLAGAGGLRIGGDPAFTGPGVGNVIAANTAAGILIRGERNFIQSNLIGVAADGTTPLGNGDAGIRIEKLGSNDGQSVFGNAIGGVDDSGELITRTANVIAHNVGPGVAIVGSENDHPHMNPIRANAIFDNGGLGIDLSLSESGGYDGPTPNDADGNDDDIGPNLLQNFPVLDEAVTDVSTTVVRGTVPGDVIGGFDIDLFTVPRCDASGHGEGAVFLGHGHSDHDSGDTFHTFEITVDATTPGHFITATATDPFGNTSEFSACHAIANRNRPPTIDMGGPYSGDEGTPIPLDIRVVDEDGSPSGHIYSFDAGNTDSGPVSGVPDDHVYADDGNFTYTFTVDDQDNPPVSGTVPITVANVAPSVSIQSLPGTATEGQSLAIQFTFSDPGLLDDPWQYSVDWGDGSPPATGQTNTRGAVLEASHAYTGAGTRTVTVTVTDKDGGTGTANQEIEIAQVVTNSAPVIESTGGPYEGFEGTAIEFTATASDPDAGTVLEYAWDFDGDGVADATTASASYTWPEDGTFDVTLTVGDGELTTSESVTVTVHNVAPTLDAIVAPVDPQPVNGTVAIGAGYGDPGTEDTHTATIDWGDGTAPDIVAVSGGNADGAHRYVDAGVYRIRMTVADDEGDVSNEQIFEYVVVYDPSAGFVTGGGWIDSPAGAYVPDPTLAGKAGFGFVARYEKGANTPSGKTEFRFQTADFTFRSTSYEWLVVAGARAQYKGVGEVNGVGGYGFLLTATDGDARGGGGTDRFRIRIVGPEGVVYDNVPGGSDALGESDPQAIARGSIVIHGK